MHRPADGLELDPVQRTVDRIETIRDIREQDRPIVLEQGPKRMCQDFVGTVPDKDARFGNAVHLGNRPFERLCVRIRIEAKVRVGRALQSAQNCG